MGEPRPAPHLSREEFRRFQALIRERSGLLLDDKHLRALRSTLAERLAATGRPSYSSYHDLLLSARGEPEFRRLIERVAINETSFFRTPGHFEALRTCIVPELLAQRGGVAMLQLWSAGCSTGEEAYSAAMSVREAIPDDHPMVIKVTGTDISERALATAASGSYSPRALRGVRPDWIARYFRREGARYVVRPELRRLVSFRYLNLIRDRYPAEDLTQIDVIFCENVLIYFDPETGQRVLQGLYECLRPGGYLFLGYSETLWHFTDALEPIDCGDGYAYRKPQAAPARRLRPVGGPPLSPTRASPAPASPPRRPASPSARPPINPATTLPPRPGGTGAESTEDELQGVDALLSAAHQHANLMERDLAIRHLTTALGLDPLQADAHLLLGILHAEGGQTEAAIEALRRALYLDPNLALAHFHLANVLRRAGRLADSAHSYARAAELLAALPEGHLVGEIPAGLLHRVCLDHLARLTRPKEG